MKAMKNISLVTLVLLISLGAADQAQARIRVKATLRTPNVQVSVDNGAYNHSPRYRQALPARYHQKVRISKRDKNVAKRLARYTGTPKRELIQLRKQGYSWREIGRWLGISRKVVRAAKTQASWRHFLNHRRPGPYCEVGGR